MSRQRRVETLSVEFQDGHCKGWAFGVPEAFRACLDIRMDQRVDQQGSKEKEVAAGRKLEQHEKVLRRVWTQGQPPAFSFARGHVFHSPPCTGSVSWADALPFVRASIVVLEARPDPGALLLSYKQDDVDGDVLDVAVSDEEGRAGWVDFEILRYEGGSVVAKERIGLSQVGFVEFLRTGSVT